MPRDTIGYQPQSHSVPPALLRRPATFCNRRRKRAVLLALCRSAISAARNLASVCFISAVRLLTWRTISFARRLACSVPRLRVRANSLRSPGPWWSFVTPEPMPQGRLGMRENKVFKPEQLAGISGCFNSLRPGWCGRRTSGAHPRPAPRKSRLQRCWWRGRPRAPGCAQAAARPEPAG